MTKKRKRWVIGKGYPDYQETDRSLVLFGNNRGGDEKRLDMTRIDTKKKYRLILEELP